ncbi:Diguanylate cyclase domain-containing protein [Rhodospirillaceae bacterium LM-1]|nr:Diguanylate cyclase domain-containing protein [Rhodospirillaceae bacterium LM-1]
MSGESEVDGGNNGNVKRSFAQHIFAPIKITWDQFVDLVIPFYHSQHIRRHAASVTISRVQLMSAIFGILVPMLSIIDWFVFPWPQWAMMTALRVASGAIFFLLAWPWETEKTRFQADAMLMAMLLVPPVFYLLSIRIVEPLQLTEFGQLVAKLYSLMPNIVLAGLAMFPLTAFEVVIFAAPAFIFAVVGLFMEGQVLSLQVHGPALWLMVLVMGVAMFSGMSQLHYMSALVNKAMIDPLTQAYTRRSGNETIELLFRLSALQNTPLSVAFFDLDKFKSINDTYGHEEGDKALRTLSDKLKAGLRKGDVLVRWGGEEFIAILNNTDAPGARVVIERLREAGFGLRPDGAPLTASIGLAERIEDQMPDWAHLVEKADSRMYQAKKSGRDRAIFPGDVVLAFSQAPA